MNAPSAPCAPGPADRSWKVERMAHLSVRNLGLRRSGRWLFRGMSWEIPRGAFIAVVGPSGVGKTSLLECLAGMLTPDEGEIAYCCAGDCLHRPSEFQERIGIVFQHLRLIPNSTLLDNVLCGRLGRYPWWRTLGPFPKRDREEATAILRDLALGPLIHRWVAETSGGEQQRTAVARALFQQPEIFLADEPVSNLDSYLTGRVLGILRQQAHEGGRTVFCVLHNPDLVSRFADYVLSLDPLHPEAWKVRQVNPTPQGK